MPTSSPLVRFVRQALTAATGTNSPDRAQLASAFDALCDRLGRRLRPVFGGVAIAALFARARHLAAADHAWLADVVPKDHERCSLEGVERVSAQVQPNAIADGLAAVLAHKIALLSALIGEDFVMPLVQEAWAETSPVERAARNEDEP
jgi:hypothetical protein